MFDTEQSAAEELLNSTLGFHLRSQKLEPPCTVLRKVLLSNFHLNGHTKKFHLQTQNARATL